MNAIHAKYMLYYCAMASSIKTDSEFKPLQKLRSEQAYGILISTGASELLHCLIGNQKEAETSVGPVVLSAVSNPMLIEGFNLLTSSRARYTNPSSQCTDGQECNTAVTTLFL